MPYSSWSDVNPAIKGIKPRVSLEQANLIASWADSIAGSKDPPDSPWAVAIANFKKTHTVRNSKWVERKQKEVDEMPSDKGVVYLDEATWTAKYVNDLPDNCFAIIQSGGKKDEAGKTVPRSLRHLPYRDADGNVDVPHLKNALSRLPQLEGIDEDKKAAAKAKLEKVAKKHLKSYKEAITQQDQGELALMMLELEQSLSDVENLVRYSFGAKYNPPQADGYGRRMGVWDIYFDHSVLGTCLIAMEYESMTPYAVSFKLVDDDNAVEFAPPSDWKRVRRTYEFIEGGEAEAEAAELEEQEQAFEEPRSGRIIRMAESADGKVAPLNLDVILIEPGMGNKADNHYYSAEMLKENAEKFTGAKMYATDHRQNEKSVGTWVSTIKGMKLNEAGSGLLAEVVVHKEWFASDLIALSNAGMLEKMECSILASGKAKPGNVNGKKAMVVTSIDEVYSVDWVTRAGAKGRAVNLSEQENPVKNIEEVEEDMKIKSENGDEIEVAESESNEEVRITEGELQETPRENEPTTEPPAIPDETKPTETDVAVPAPEITFLGEAEVELALIKSKLPEIAAAKLKESKYQDAEGLQAAIAKEVEYIKAIGGGGKVFGLGASTTPPPQKLSEAEIQQRLDEVDKRYGAAIIKT